MQARRLALALLVLLGGCGKEQHEKHNESLWQAPVSAQAPRCVIRLATPHATHDDSLFNAVKQFATSHGFKERDLNFNIRYSGPTRLEAVYETEQFAIWSWDASLYYVAPKTTNYVELDFRELTNSLGAAIGAAFPGRVEVRPPENWKL